MKLDAAQQRTVEEQLGIEAIPEEHPVTPSLKEAFGDHTFFLSADGLSVIEEDPAPDNSQGNIIKIASWTSEARTELKTHKPEVLPVTVELASEGEAS